MHRLAFIPLALIASSTGCSAQPASGPAAPQSASPSASDRPANLPETAPPFAVAPLGTFDDPFAMAFLPDGSLLVTEKAGRLKLRRADGSVTVVGGTPKVAGGGQGGLLDVAVAPDFVTSRAIYLSFSEARPGGSGLALARATLTGTALTDVRIIWRSGSDGQGGQYGANIAFAPDGQSLFLSSGERQRFTPAQDPDQAIGKIVHLTLGGAPAPGNPMAGKTGAATITVIEPPKNTAAAARATGRIVPARQPNTTPAETWSSGHRNPYGLAFDGGGRLWEVEMGPKGGDEVNLILPGRNYGWPLVSNGDNYDGSPIPDHATDPRFEAPKLWWNPSISPGGMFIYSGAMFPQWRGSMFVAALGGEALIRIELDGDRATPANQWSMGARIRDVAQAPDGAIWAIEDGGDARLLRLTPKR